METGGIVMKSVPDSIMKSLPKYGITAFTPLSQHDDVFYGQGTCLKQLNHPKLGELSGIFVEIPVDVSLRTKHQKTLDNVDIKETSDEDIEEAVSHVLRLKRRNQIGPANGHSNATHIIKTDDMGRKVLVRTRYS